MKHNRMIAAVALSAAALLPLAADAQRADGGLYIAGAAGFTFKAAAEQALAGNPAGQRFFLLAVPPQTSALQKDAPRNLAGVRERVQSRGGVIFVCQRDIDKGRIDPATLVPGIVAVRGWGPKGESDLPVGERYFPGEDRIVLPKSNEALRRLRATCAY